MSIELGNKSRPLQVGEIVRARDAFGFIPDNVYRVLGVMGDLISLQAGDIRLGTTTQTLLVTERGVREPSSWLESEIEVLKAQVDICDCPECRRSLERKSRLLKKQRSH